MDEQTPADSSVEERLANFLTPEAAPEEAAQDEQTQPIEQAQEEQPAEQAPDGEAFETEDGEQYILPPKLKAEVEKYKAASLRQADYTQKTQALAELTRQANVIHETLQAQQQFEQHVSSDREELASVKRQLGQFKNLNWADFSVEQHLQLRQQMESLKDRATELNEAISHKKGEFDSWMEGRRREALEAGQKYLTQNIKGWGPEAVQQVTAAAMDVGFSKEEIGNVMDPRFIRLAWEAAQFRRLQAGKPAAVAAAQKAPPVLRPGPTQGAKAQADVQYKDMRGTLRKSGSIDDAARLLSKF